jgi:hypothetical protein
VRVPPTSLDLRRYRHLRRHDAVGPPVVCWVGTSGNYRDLEVVHEALRALVEADVVRLRVISDRPLDGAQWPGAEWVPWSFGHEAQELARCDIGIMPLRDDERTRGRCGYKALQLPGREAARRRLPGRRRGGSRARRRDGHLRGHRVGVA